MRNRESGQDLAEYALILGLVGIIAFLIVSLVDWRDILAVVKRYPIAQLVEPLATGAAVLASLLTLALYVVRLRRERRHRGLPPSEQKRRYPSEHISSPPET